MDSDGIEVRALETHEELVACVELQRETWGSDFSDRVPVSILKVSQRVGGVAAGAFAPDNKLLGFVFGLTGVERGRIVHWSDMLAVRPEARRLGLGRRLKEYQRTVVRERGGEVIYWTYDPLVARNAHLNFNRLGVRLAEYAEDMYGITDSVLHGGIPTDRLVVAWPTRDDDVKMRVAEAARTLASGDCTDGPVVTPDWIERAAGASILPHCLRVEIPADAEAILTQSRDEAREWRMRVRQSLQWCLSAGYLISAVEIDDRVNLSEATDAPTESSHAYYLMTKPARPTLATGGRQ
jgi:predicted GNAT superfamily acetyltransferase